MPWNDYLETWDSRPVTLDQKTKIAVLQKLGINGAEARKLFLQSRQQKG